MSKDNTARAYNEAVEACKELFMRKARDYGSAWRILRLPSLTDQIMIKAQRIRSIQEKGRQRVADSVRDEFVGVSNYSVMALIQLQMEGASEKREPLSRLEKEYDKATKEAFALAQNKNHDYDEAWRAMRISSITDIILMKLLRIKQIEDNAGKTHISEGVKANYQDILNYAIFALIRLGKS